MCPKKATDAGNGCCVDSYFCEFLFILKGHLQGLRKRCEKLWKEWSGMDLSGVETQ